MVGSTKIMRVPNSFHNLIKEISEKKNVDMTITLKDAERILYNSDKLTSLFKWRRKL